MKEVNPIDPRENVALMASAGTGKTFSLALRAVVTLMRGKTADIPLYDMYGETVTGTRRVETSGRVMCLTFTRKATAEMGKRVHEYLGKLANGQYGPERAEYQMVAETLDIASPAEMQGLASATRQRLFKDPRLLYISTIDGFMTLILRLFLFEAGLRPDFTILADAGTRQLEKEAMRLTFGSFPDQDRYFSLLRRYIRWQDMQPASFALDLTEGVKWALDNYIPLEPTLLRAAHDGPGGLEALMDGAEANDLRVRELLEELTGRLSNNPHVLANKKNRIKFLQSQVKGRFSCHEVVPKADALCPDSVLKKGHELDGAYRATYDELKTCLRRYTDFYGRLNAGVVLFIASRAYTAMNLIKDERGQLTFSDITRIVHYLMNQQSYPLDNEHLYFRLDGRLEHILVDEFQDTSSTQWEILRPLAEEAMSGAAQNDKVGSFFCVGDSKQAIYRFRGATPGFMDSLVRHYEGRLQGSELKVNHRSDIHIVETANALFADADNTIDGGPDLSFSFLPQQAHSTAPGYVRVEEITGANEPERSPIRLLHLQRAIEDLLEKGFRYADIAVIVTKKDNGVTAHRFLQEQDIPSSLEFSEALSARRAYGIIRALVRYIYDRSAYALAEFLLTPPAVALAGKVMKPERLRRYRAILDAHLKRTEEQSIYARIHAVGKSLNLNDRLAEDPDYGILTDVMAGHLSAEKNPLVFLRELERIAGELRGGKSRGGAVSILTTHGAKGLQFPATILFKVKEGFSLHQNTKYFIDTSQEEPVVRRRLSVDLLEYAPEAYREALRREEAFVRFERINQLYVAVTRAVHALYIFADGDRRANTDTYILGHFPGGYTAGELAVLSPPKEEGHKASKDTLALFAWNALLPLLRGEEAQAGAPLHMLTRAEKHAGNRLAQREEEEAPGSEPYSSRFYGLFFHEAVYQLEDYSPVAAAIAADKAWSLYGGYLEGEAKDKCTRDLALLVSTPEWRKIIDSAVIYREKPVFYGGALLIVDMFAKTADEIRVVDFKTAAPDGPRTEEYREQVKRYETALSAYYGLPARGWLVYIHDGRADIRQV